MAEKPVYAEGYPPEKVQLVHSACLHLATVLGDYMDDLVVVGGLVPSLLIQQANQGEAIPKHVGTMDLDLGMALALLQEKRYSELATRLRQSGFMPDRNEKGNETSHRWRLKDVTVDFLMPITKENEKPGRLKHLEKEFAAITMEGVELAFQDREKISFEGPTFNDGERTEREVWVCGPGAFVVLKALALSMRAENKDAYDLFYVLRNYENGPEDVAKRFGPIMDNPNAIRALRMMERDFGGVEQTGPRRLVEFLFKGENEDLQAEAVTVVAKFLRSVKNLNR